jgi:hypothetical protein
MATESPGRSAPGNDSVADRIARLNRKADEEVAARRRAKSLSTLMTLLIVTVAVGGVYVMIRPGIAAYNNPEPYRQALSAEFEQTLQPAIQQILQEEQTQQVLQQAGETAMSRVRERESEISSAIEAQLRQFAADMQTWSQEQLAERPGTLHDSVHQAMVEAFPEMQDEVVAQNMNEAMNNVVSRVLSERLGRHSELLASISDQIDTFPVPAEIQAMSDDELSEALTENLGVFAMQMFGQQLNPETRSFLAGIGQVAPSLPEAAEAPIAADNPTVVTGPASPEAGR